LCKFCAVQMSGNIYIFLSYELIICNYTWAYLHNEQNLTDKRGDAEMLGMTDQWKEEQPIKW